MKTLKLATLVAGLAFIALNATAQEKVNMDPQQMAQKQTAQIKESVTGITADQESKILVVEQDFAKSVQDLRTSSDRDEMRSKMKPLRESRDAKIKAILTADQYAQYEKMEESRQRNGAKRGGGQ